MLLPALACDTSTVSGDDADAAVASDANDPHGDGTTSDADPGECDCLLGDGPYCGQRANDEAEQRGCTMPDVGQSSEDLLECEAGVWSVLEACGDHCDYTPSSMELDDACVLPECECFVQVAWCGAGAATVAAELGCQIPLLPEHNGDILYCPDGVWSVRQSCPMGCVEAPTGTPDYCLSTAAYRLPFDCNTSHNCTNGNHTSSHDGKDECAYDFGMPVGTTIRASRAGQVLRVRMVSLPGDACYNGGGSACANLANTVEVRHSDGSVALYMHLSSASVSVGDPVVQGSPLGLSGNSGWSTGPHLHTQVQADCGIWWCQSVPYSYEENSSITTGTLATSASCAQ